MPLAEACKLQGACFVLSDLKKSHETRWELGSAMVLHVSLIQNINNPAKKMHRSAKFPKNAHKNKTKTNDLFCPWYLQRRFRSTCLFYWTPRRRRFRKSFPPSQESLHLAKNRSSLIVFFKNAGFSFMKIGWFFVSV